MSRRCSFEELPKPCQECDYLHCNHLRMNGENDWTCMMRNMDVRRDFRNGKACVEDEPTVQREL